MSGFYHVTIGSLPDYEELVAEIYINDRFIGLISQESGAEHSVFEIAASDNVGAMKVDLTVLERAIVEAKERLNALYKPRQPPL